MCGIVGIAGKLALKDEASMKRLLLIDFFRGTAATGFAAIRSADESSHVVKVPSHPLDLFEVPAFRTALSGHNSKVFMGHNRAPTRGENNKYNAHPFECGHIIGVHNGTLEHTSARDIEEELNEPFGTDSEAIFMGFAKLGVEKTLSLMEEGKDGHAGAWSLQWYDKSDKSINFLRNKHRPMFYAYTKEFDRLFWASSWPMIQMAVDESESGYELHRDPEKGVCFFTTNEDIHYKMEVADLLSDSKKRPKFKAKPMKGKEPVAVVSHVADPFGRETEYPEWSGVMGYGPRGENSKTKTGGLTSNVHRDKNSKDVQVIHLLGDIKNPFAGMLTEERFNSIAKDGCCYCGATVSYNDVGLTIFERDDIVICALCSDHKENQLPANRLHVSAKVIEGCK